VRCRADFETHLLLAVSLLHRATTGAEIFASCARSYGQSPLLGQVLLEVLEHGGDAASPSLKEVSVQGGKLRPGKDERREGASRVGEAPIGRCGTSAFDGCTKAGQVVFFRQRRDVPLKRDHGGHGTALGGCTERRLNARPAHQVHRLTDCVDERDDILYQASLLE
jgi:hypothetical protein